MIKDDIYYFAPNYNRDKRRDPDIVKYIPITDEAPDYINNIKLIKKLGLFKLFIDSINQNKFYSIIMEQIKKIVDIKNIFEIFDLKDINKDFINRINKLKNTILDENPKAYDDIFIIFSNWLIINKNNSFDMNHPIDIICMNQDIPTQYFIYLLKEKNKFIINLMKDRINIDNNPELFIDLLLNSEDELCSYYLEKIKIRFI